MTKEHRSKMLELADDYFLETPKWQLKESIITQSTMRQFLERCHNEGIIDLTRQWPICHDPDASYSDIAKAWTTACRRITVISLIDYEIDHGARSSINDVELRFDEPGSMDPNLQATIMFAPAYLLDLEYDQIGQLRRKARKLFVVHEVGA